MMSDKSMQAILKRVKPTPMSGSTPQRISSVNRSSATMDAIKSLILNRRLQPGDPLPSEAQLCEDLGVSRSSVREALRKLEALDIVRVQQGRGSFVGEMSLEPMVETLILRYATDHSSGHESLRNVVSMRRYIDLGISENLVAAMKGTENPELENLTDVMVEKAKASSTYLDEDIAFHNGLTAYLNNELLDQIAAAMWMVHQAFIPELDIEESPQLLETAQAHQKMLETAQEGNLDAYRDAVFEHYAPLAQILELS